QDLASPWPVLRTAAQQLATEAVQILGDPRSQISGRWRLSKLFFPHHLRGLAPKGTLAGESLVEHDSQAVPVAPFGGGEPRSLFGCHVSGCPRHRQALMLAVGKVELRDEAEIQQNDAPLARDQTIGRFDVAMELAGRVKRPDSGSGLTGSDAQALDVHR